LNVGNMCELEGLARKGPSFSRQGAARSRGLEAGYQGAVDICLLGGGTEATVVVGVRLLGAGRHPS
jgi:hypothetical protein